MFALILFPRFRPSGPLTCYCLRAPKRRLIIWRASRRAAVRKNVKSHELSSCSYWRAGCERPVSYSAVHTDTIVLAVLSAITRFGAFLRLFATCVTQHFGGMVIAGDSLHGAPCRRCFQDHRPCQPMCSPFGGG